MVEKRVKVKVLKNINIFIIFISLIIFLISLFIKLYFKDITFEQLIYNILFTEGANYDIVFEGIYFAFIRLLLIIFIFFCIYLIYKWLKIKITFNFKFKNKINKINILSIRTVFFVALLSLFISISFSYNVLGVGIYLEAQNQASTFIEDNYVDARDVEFVFPKEKRNLIYIFAESLEATNASKDNGGLMDKSYIPKLEKLAMNNLNFSNTNKIGGAVQLNNTNWTIAALIAHTSGLPLKLYIDSNEYKGYSQSLPGAYSIGEILKENGYNNYFMIGSDAVYGGRKDYFEQHGEYTIYDYNYAKENKYIEPNYHVWWGYEDAKLFEYAKEKILEASKLDEPFNFTILTVDTHFTDGYMDDSCKEKFDTKYANSIYCSDSKINSFVNWVKKQDFYDDTTIIISGDHLTMQKDFYLQIPNYDRTIFNVFINTEVETEYNKNRLFSAFDMYPTTLAALGVEIKGNKLGLGTNLFSGDKTLLEEYGVEYVNNEIMKKSFFYDNVILGNTYYEMQDRIDDNK